jgi:hypothetical protein
MSWSNGRDFVNKVHIFNRTLLYLGYSEEIHHLSLFLSLSLSLSTA